MFSLRELTEFASVSAFRWSRDGSSIAYIRSGGEKSELWILRGVPNGGRKRVGEELSVAECDWHPDGKHVVLVADGQIYVADLEGLVLRQLTAFPGTKASVTYSPDGTRIAFKGPDGLFVMNSDGTCLSRIVKLDDPSGFFGGVYTWSPEGDRIAFETLRWDLQCDIGVVNVMDGSVMWVAKTELSEFDPQWLPDGQSILYCRRDLAYKTHEIVLKPLKVDSHLSYFDVEKNEVSHPRYCSENLARVLYRETDTNGGDYNFEVELSPDGRRVAFVSRLDGWSHLYVLDVETTEITRITEGHFEVSCPRWSPDGKYIAVLSNKDADPSERHVWVYSWETRSGFCLTADPLANRMVPSWPRGHLSPWSPNGDQVAYIRSSAKETPDLFLVNTRELGNEICLSELCPVSLKENGVVPCAVEIESYDGMKIYGYEYRPEQTGATCPAIILLHGGPMAQSGHQWHPIFQPFIQRAVAKGYVCLALNYRGGIGYGKAFEQASYGDMGRALVGDIVKAAEYLKSLPIVDGSRLGLMGHSYGGYLTVHTLELAPSLFKAAVEVAGVMDWRNYTKFGVTYFIMKMGHPQDYPERYRDWSPVDNVASIETPLLVIHGTKDLNVRIEEHAYPLIKELIHHKKEFEMRIYPDEPHVYVRPDVRYDLLKTTESFFDRYLLR